MKNFFITFIGIILFQLISFNLYGQTRVTIDSPTGKSKAVLELSDGELYWSVSWQGKQVLKRSKLGLVIGKHTVLDIL